MDLQQTIALCGIEESVCRLVGLYCMADPAEQDLSAWFSKIDFELLPPEVSCMAAAAAATDYAFAPPELIPRLRGIIKYVHTLNSGMMAGLYALGKQFNEKGFSAELLGSTAVHLGYPMPPVRHLWQAQVGVSEADFPYAVELAVQSGFAVEQTPYTAIARRGKTQCVHICKVSDRQAAQVRAVGGVLFGVPASAQLLVQLADALIQMLLERNAGRKLIPWIMDLHCVIASVADWQTVAADCARQKVPCRVRLMLELYNCFTQDSLPESVLAFFDTESHTKHLIQLLHSYRKCHADGSKALSLWLRIQIQNDGNTAKSVPALIAILLKKMLRKI